MEWIERALDFTVQRVAERGLVVAGRRSRLHPPPGRWVMAAKAGSPEAQTHLGETEDLVIGGRK